MPADGPFTISIVTPATERKAVSETVPLIYATELAVVGLGLPTPAGAVTPLPPHATTLRPRSSAKDWFHLIDPPWPRRPDHRASNLSPHLLRARPQRCRPAQHPRARLHVNRACGFR